MSDRNEDPQNENNGKMQHDLPGDAGAPKPAASGDNTGSLPFDLEALRLRQDFDAMSGVKKVLATVPVRKPNDQEFIRVHRLLRLATKLLEIKGDREMYLVSPELWGAVPELKNVELRLTMSSQRVLAVWPLRLPGEDGRSNPWWDSARDAAERAETNWVKLRSNMSLGAYEIFIAGSDLFEPEWPELSLAEILQIAFRNKIIRELDHPVLRRLRGEL